MLCAAVGALRVLHKPQNRRHLTYCEEKSQAQSQARSLHGIARSSAAPLLTCTCMASCHLGAENSGCIKASKQVLVAQMRTTLVKLHTQCSLVLTRFGFS